MKKVFLFSSSLAVVLLVGFACKKSTTTTTPKTTTSTTGSTTSASTNTTTTNFTVDGTAAQNPTAGGLVYGTSYYAVTGVDGNNGTPTVQLTFNGTSSPASGSYPITAGTSPAAGHCGLLMTNNAGSAVASSGTVTVVAGAPSDAYFTSVVCTGTAGTHTVTGNLKW